MVLIETFLVTHGCIIANVQLFLPDGKEAKARFLQNTNTFWAMTNDNE